MKKLIVSVLMLMAATFIFSQGNGEVEDRNAQQDILQYEDTIASIS